MKDVFADKEVHAVSMPCRITGMRWPPFGRARPERTYTLKSPLATILWGRQMVAEARKYSRIVQVGSQGRSIAHKIRAAQLLQEGVIGKCLHGSRPLF